jgi:hypothetical protein
MFRVMAIVNSMASDKAIFRVRFMFNIRLRYMGGIDLRLGLWFWLY